MGNLGAAKIFRAWPRLSLVRTKATPLKRGARWCEEGRSSQINNNNSNKPSNYTSILPVLFLYTQQSARNERLFL